MSKCQVRVSWRRRGIGAGIDEVTRADRLDSNRALLLPVVEPAARVTVAAAAAARERDSVIVLLVRSLLRGRVGRSAELVESPIGELESDGACPATVCISCSRQVTRHGSRLSKGQDDLNRTRLV